jgi:membrane-bound acyltransferase YfiQ involved in biofilm formation
MTILGWTFMFFLLYDPGVNLKVFLAFLLAKLHVMAG